MPPPFITKVRLVNYKSIAACDVDLGPLTYLVGPNGSGKSNFLDALQFVTDSLRSSLDHAMRERSGIGEVRRRSTGHPTHFGIQLHFNLSDSRQGIYAFRVGAKRGKEFVVQEERCQVWPSGIFDRVSYYHVKDGQMVGSSIHRPPASTEDRLFLVNASGFPEFRAVYDALSSMGFYSLNPQLMRDLQPPDPGDLLKRDGANIASVFKRIGEDPVLKTRIEKLLEVVVPSVHGVEALTVGPKETLEFRHEVTGAKHPWRFFASSMSDGTLRALGILVALFQRGGQNGRHVPLVGIEEPESALHPAAAGLLRDALRSAAESVQVVVTSHSADLLDESLTSTENILSVVMDEGGTSIAHLSPAARSVLRDRLFTPGELLRANQLDPDPDEITKGKQGSPDLFRPESWEL